MASDVRPMPEPSGFTNFPVAADLKECKSRYVSGAEEDVLTAGSLVVCPLVILNSSQPQTPQEHADPLKSLL